jgi:hypothetical protein
LSTAALNDQVGAMVRNPSDDVSKYYME